MPFVRVSNGGTTPDFVLQLSQDGNGYGALYIPKETLESYNTFTLIAGSGVFRNPNQASMVLNTAYTIDHSANYTFLTSNNWSPGYAKIKFSP